jgi:PAS domain S-box-containing protein
MNSHRRQQEALTTEQAELHALRRRVAELEQRVAQGSPDGHTQQPQRPPEPIEASTEALLALFDTMSDGLLLLDSEQRVLVANQSLANMLQTTPATLRGCSWAQVCTDMRNRALCEPIHHTVQQQRNVRSRKHWRTANGQNRILDIETMLLPARNTQESRLMLRVTDVTERLQLEASLIQSEHRAAAEKLSATIAHEVNTPLQTIQSSLYMAGRADDAQRARHLARAATQVERISAILERLLSLHRIDSVPPTLIDMPMLLERLLDLLRATLELQQITVRLDLAPDLPRLWGKADDLNQALLNLLINAIEAMPNGGTLTIRARYSSAQPHLQSGTTSSVRITIADTGHGMLPEVQTHAFDPFFTTRPDRQGIGLAVSRKTLLEHGGSIDVYSKPGAGSSFVITLPLPTEQIVNDAANTPNSTTY